MGSISGQQACLGRDRDRDSDGVSCSTRLCVHAQKFETALESFPGGEHTQVMASDILVVESLAMGRQDVGGYVST